MKTMTLVYSGSIKIWWCCQMGLIMRASGTLKQSSDMEEAIKSGAMEVFTKVIGKVIKLMAAVD
jgi:hypothetical protein